MKRFLPIMILLLLFVSACDPFKAGQIKAEAQATQIVEQAQQDALNQDANRQHAQELFDLEKQQKELELGRNQAIEGTKRNGLNMLWQTIFIVLTAAAIFVIFYTARIYQYTAQGIARATVQTADIRSRLIYLDSKTGQYPLLLEHVGKGIVTLTDPNTATVMTLDTRQAGDRQLIDGATAIRHTYVLSSAAARSDNPAGISIIEPPRQYQHHQTLAPHVNAGVVDVSTDTQVGGDDES